MAAFNVSLDDSSPLISYSPSNAWLDTPANDTLSKFYASESLHTTSLDGATAQLTFNGTGVWFYGGLRPHYGSYTFLVDGVKVLQADADAADPELGRLLAGISGLKMGQHTVQLKNAGTGPIDLDSAIFETTVGTAGGSVTDTTIDDTNTKIKYEPSPSDWALDSNSAFFNNSLHFSETEGAQASLSFSGDAVALYGTVSPQHANYIITLDGQVSQQLDASDVRELHSQTLLYFAQDLGSSEHTLVITGNPGKDTGKYVDIDFVKVYSTSIDHDNDSVASSSRKDSSTATSATTSKSSSSATGSTTASSGSSAATATSMSMSPAIANYATSMGSTADATSTGMANPSSVNNAVAGNASRLSSGAVAGIVIGSLLGLLGLLVLLFFLLRRRRGSAQVISTSSSSNPTDPSPVLPMQQEPDLEAAYGYDSPNSIDKQIQMRQAEAQVYAELDAMGKRVSSTTRGTRWSQASYDSSSTLKHTEPPLPKWDTSGPVPTLVLADRDSMHTRNGSQTSTVVNEEVRQGVSEVILRPSYLSDGPKSAPVRPPRPPSLAFSVTHYYFEA